MHQPLVWLLYVAALTSTVVAQNIFIARPKAGTNVTAGSNITVQLDKPMSLTGSEDIAVVIGMFPCTRTSECPDITEVLGVVLYKGPYAAELHDDDDDPYQNFTVTVPSWYKGPVQLGVAHFFLLGAGSSAQLQFSNATLNVVASG